MTNCFATTIRNFSSAEFSNPRDFRTIKMGAKEVTVCWKKPEINSRCVSRFANMAPDSGFES